jgi:Flp pilus assembly protein TadG
MRLLNSRRPRSGAHLPECAVVYPVTFFIILATIAGGIGVSDYQQVAYLAREAARFASAHAGQYAKENAAAITAGTLPTVNQSYIINNIVMPEAQASLLNTSNLTVQITFYSSTNSTGTPWDTALANNTNWPSSQTSVDGTTYSETNTVGVTVSYQWTPAYFLTGPITLQSTSVMPICY